MPRAPTTTAKDDLDDVIPATPDPKNERGGPPTEPPRPTDPTST